MHTLAYDVDENQQLPLPDEVVEEGALDERLGVFRKHEKCANTIQQVLLAEVHLKKYNSTRYHQI